jgi:hypothetical protein
MNPEKEQLQRELAEVIESLSADARDAWERLQELHEQGGDLEDHKDEVVAIIEPLYPSAREELTHVRELKARFLKANAEEHQGMASLHKQMMGLFYKAWELDPSLPKDATTSDAIEVLKRCGVRPGVSEELLEMEMEVPTSPEEGEYVVMPIEEMDVDENGIPTARAVPDGFAIRGGEEHEDIYLDRKEAEATRLLAKDIPYSRFLEEHAVDAEELRQEFVDALFPTVTYSVEETQQLANEMVTGMMQKIYLQSLATVVKAEPDVQGMIDHLTGKDTAAGRSYKHRILMAVMGEVMDEYIEEAVDDGEIIREVGEDGREIRRFNENHPKYQRKLRELEEKKEGLSPERSNIFEALQDERRGKHRMNEFAAMRTVEQLTAEEVSKLQFRLRRVRRGLELPEIL